MNKNKNVLIIFTKTPQLGNCKTRIAQTVGEQKALDIYKYLLAHTNALVKPLQNCDKFVYYSNEVVQDDIWCNNTYYKSLQFQDEDLGLRMRTAFQELFDKGYKNVIVIGSDLYDLSTEDLEKAFQHLQTHDFTLGPCQDGGYYLLGMNTFSEQLFQDKQWSTDTVFAETLNDILDLQKTVSILEMRNDIDYYEDIIGIPELEALL